MPSGPPPQQASSGTPSPSATHDAGEAAPRRRTPPVYYLWAALLVAAATGLCSLGSGVLALPDLVMIYLLAIMIVAAFFDRGPSLAAAALSVAAYDFFFIPPLFTFSVTDARNLLTFGTMFVVGLLISGLTLRIRRKEHQARRSEEQSAALYALSRDLGAATDETEALDVIVRHAAAALNASAAGALVPGAGGELRMAAQQGELRYGEAERAAARWTRDRAQIAGRGTDERPDATVTCYPLRRGADVVGVLVLGPRDPGDAARSESEFSSAFLRHSALAVERARLAGEARASSLRARAEEMRSALLSAVSHDLRTPLAAVTGAASSLRDDEGMLGPAEKAELVATICEEAERLERLVGNLLDMTRLDSGTVRLRREWVPFDEIAGSVLSRLEARLGDRPVRVTHPETLPLLWTDPVLIEQVVLNLVENAAKYTPAGSPLELDAAGGADGSITIELRDRGPGIPPGDEERIFDKFHRGNHAGVSGAGLGLPICRAIVEAHGGQISAENRVGGGALFRVLLPRMADQPPQPEPLPAEAAL